MQENNNKAATFIVAVLGLVGWVCFLVAQLAIYALTLYGMFWIGSKLFHAIF